LFGNRRYDGDQIFDLSTNRFEIKFPIELSRFRREARPPPLSANWRRRTAD